MNNKHKAAAVSPLRSHPKETFWIHFPAILSVPTRVQHRYHLTAPCWTSASFLSCYRKIRITQTSGKCHLQKLKRHGIPAVSSHSCCSIPQTPGELWGCRALKCRRNVSPCVHKMIRPRFFHLYTLQLKVQKLKQPRKCW